MTNRLLFFLLCSTPSYDYAPNPDKQWILRVTQQMEPVHRRFTDLLMTKRLQTLQSVDVAVERVFNVIFFGILFMWILLFKIYFVIFKGT